MRRWMKSWIWPIRFCRISAGGTPRIKFFSINISICFWHLVWVFWGGAWWSSCSPYSPLPGLLRVFFFLIVFYFHEGTVKGMWRMAVSVPYSGAYTMYSSRLFEKRSQEVEGSPQVICSMLWSAQRYKDHSLDNVWQWTPGKSWFWIIDHSSILIITTSIYFFILEGRLGLHLALLKGLFFSLCSGIISGHTRQTILSPQYLIWAGQVS